MEGSAEESRAAAVFVPYVFTLKVVTQNYLIPFWLDVLVLLLLMVLHVEISTSRTNSSLD
jgi:hypothetical protein